ncbi:coagulation factor V [Poeciliopsis prolifica]|uniref:coagulation factor V n=1 Tax=Poeciliopsis prolifica TaxID=188132 RepID=UPI00241432E7|nr:coagulation factor V [Poeciliopsis prolifica]
MKLCPGIGVHRLLHVLVLLAALVIKVDLQRSKERRYYIAAVEINWNYSPNDANRQDPTYKKVVFREYDETFSQAKTHPPWLGLLGPTLRAEEGETIVVTFRNMAYGAYSIHPHGVAYGKQSEGANYFDNTSQKEKEDDIVQPNGEHVYTWEVTPEVSPLPDDPDCLTYTYISHQNVVQDYNSGLIGALLICKAGTLDESGQQMGLHKEFVFLFGVFDEKESLYSPGGHSSDDHVKYTINGYTRGSLPAVSICAHAPVSLHLVGMSSEPEVFSVHMNGQVLSHSGHKVSSVGLISGSSATASLVSAYAGRWLLSSFTTKHMEAGMHGFVDVRMCEEFAEPVRKMTVIQRRHSKEWKYYIAAEEIVWDYSKDSNKHIDQDFKLQYLTRSARRIGSKYKKAVYTQYKNESFTERVENEHRKNEQGILGPVIRAQIRDIITIVFKNLASRPYSIYPHGLTLDKSEEGVNYPAGGNQTHGVRPGETHTYTWKVLEENEPLDGESQCLTRMYHSAVDTPRDIASGLIGPMLICKSQSLDVRNVQLRADKEQHAVFSVFDENKSWYLDENIRRCYDQSKVNKADPDFYKSNVMHTINGYVFESGPDLGFCYGEVPTWHVSSIGAQNYIQTATFYGHPFELNHRTEDILSLYPMTGETIKIPMDNIGFWLLASLNTHETTKGMRVKFQDVECYRELQYEYEDNDVNGVDEFTQWKPPTFEDVKKEKEKSKSLPTEPVEIDIYTDMFADELGLRSLRNQSRNSDVEILDLSLFDYDDTDVAPVVGNASPNVKDTKNKTELFSNQTTVNDTQWKYVDNQNVTEHNLHNSSITKHATAVQKNRTQSFLDNYTTVLNSDGDSLSNQSTATTNRTVSVVAVSPNNASFTVAELMNSTVLNATGSTVLNATGSTVLNATGSTRSTLLNATLSTLLNATRSTLLNATRSTVHGNASANGVNISTSSKQLTSITMGALQTTSQPTGKQESTNQTMPVQSQDTTKINTTLTTNTKDGRTESNPSGSSNTFMDIFFSRENDVQLPRGDMFFYTGYATDTDTDPVGSLLFQQTSALEDDHNTSSDVSPVGLNQSLLGFDIKEADNRSMVKDNLTSIELVETTGNNEGNSSNMTLRLELGLQMNVTEGVSVSANSSLGNATYLLNLDELSQNGTVNISKSSSVGRSSKKGLLPGELSNSSMESFSNETRGSSNHSLSGGSVKLLSSEEFGSSESSEEIFIYVKENKSEAIKTVSLSSQGHNWTYDGTHSMVPEEIPDHMKKYFENKALQTTPPPKRYKKVNLRQIPKKGEGMKTRRRKVYKPQARGGSPFSPRGFNPEFTPRGARPIVPQPVTKEEELINFPIVIALPRPDFSDYQLYVPEDEPEQPDMNEQDVTQNEYEYVSYKDPYSSHEDIKDLNLDETTKYYLKLSGPDIKTYFIAAEEVEWDYAGYGQRRHDKSQQNMLETKFTKVVFRGYLDASFSTPDLRGEMDEHLGILGPVIKAEVGQSIMIVFKNNANRPYSLHPNGVSYTKQFEGLSYEDGSKHWYKYDNEVQPNTTYTYIWKISPMVGPAPEESECRTWAYYSGVNPEKDIHSGLIGPLLVCREGTLKKKPLDTREFVLLFMTFDESQSWYYNKNQEVMQRKYRKRVWDDYEMENLKFHSINGIIYSLKGLRMYTNQLVRWHLMNMGSPKDVHSVYFHGQTFRNVKTKSYRQAVFPLLPGSFATLEMYPSKPGLWQLETEVGRNQKRGMQTLFLVLDNDCYHPMGLESGSVKDDQITASNSRGYWAPHLARLNNQGKYNAWSTDKRGEWIQVDFKRPVVISLVATQGARQLFQSQYATNFSISYSNDRRKWIFYKGDSREFWKTFQGNEEASQTKKNIFFPPLIGRFIRLHPITWNNAATIRMEFYGCELDGCSVPLGMESRLIEDRRITASSEESSWFSGLWKASFGRLNKLGSINAWRAKHNDMNQWLQVELPRMMKITGIITQGAKSMTKEMYVTKYALQYSDNGIHWTYYMDDDDVTVKMFDGNTNNNDHVRNYIYPPIFTRFIRIVPKRWWNSITMRVELLGCDFE